MSTPHRVNFASYAAQVVSSPYGGPVDEAPLDTSSLSSINSQLLTHGWAKRPLKLEALGEKDYHEVVGVLFELLGASVSNLLSLDTFAARHRTLQYEHERLQKTSSNQNSAIARGETELAGWKARCADVEKRLALEEGKTKELREENSRGRKAIETVRIAAGHDAKKTQIKLDKAQAQLVRISNDSSILSRPQGLMLLNPITGNRTQPVAPGQLPLLEQSLKDLAEIRQSLQEETEAFRAVVVSTGNGLREAVAAASGDEPPARLMHSQFFSNPHVRSLGSSHSHITASSTSHPSIADVRLRGLIASIRAKLVEGVPVYNRGNAVPEAVEEDIEARRKEEREQDRQRQDLLDKVKDLEVEVTCAQAREEEAKRLVEEFAKVQMASTARPIALEDEEDDVHETLSQQKELLDEERKKFTEAAVRLGQERRQLEAERQKFLEERRQADVQAMLDFLPPTPEGGSHDAYSDEAGPSSSTDYRINSPSPSPLSPQTGKVRTPKNHTAGKRRPTKTKTPLSRLVLEKTVRQKRDTVLGEGGRRGNAQSGSSSAGSGAEVVEKRVAALGASTLGKSQVQIPAPAQVKRDLTKAGGIGPQGASRGSKAWR